MDKVINYFTGEKEESYIFLILGMVGLAMSIYFILVNASSFWRGLAIPFVIVSVLEVIVGVTLIYRSPKDIIRVEHYIKNEKSKIKTVEIPRMEKVMKNFVIFRNTEIALILAGICIYFIFGKFDFWKGLGLGFFIQASVVLTLDYFAEKRGFIYLEHLNKIANE
jgi:uncharacterized membrane protein